MLILDLYESQHDDLELKKILTDIAFYGNKKAKCLYLHADFISNKVLFSRITSSFKNF
jgi:hypothetical protein